MAAMVYCSLWETNYSKCGLREKATQGDWLIGHVLHYDSIFGDSAAYYEPPFSRTTVRQLLETVQRCPDNSLKVCYCCCEILKYFESSLWDNGGMKVLK